MMARILRSKKTTLTLWLLLVILLIVASYVYLGTRSARASVLSNVMYLIPSDGSAVETSLTPEKLNEAGLLQVGFTSNWQVINDLASKQQLQALIIHHAAIDQVDQAQLQDLFKYKRLVVAGIGI